MSTFSFCETPYASPLAKWHIRPLTAKGQKLGGGADTPALCGRTVAWDLAVPFTAHHLAENACEACRVAYAAKMAEVSLADG